MKLQSNKKDKISTGIYIEKELLEEVAIFAKKNNLSTNDCMNQLIKIGIETIKKGK